jgi:putative ABC transport system permease protein
MDTLFRDTRQVLRFFSKNPGYALAAVFALTLGIGANTGIFSVVNTILLKPLPISHQERVVMVYDHQKGAADDRTMVSPGNFLDWKAQSSVFSAFSPAGYQYYNITGFRTPTSQLGVRVTSDFFKIMDMKPLLGRGIQPDEEDDPGKRVVVVRYSFWKKYLGGDPAILGKTLNLNGSPYTIIGVMPSGYVYPAAAQIWVPAAFSPEEKAYRWRYLFAIGRLKPTAAVATAQEQLSSIARRLEKEYPDTNANWGVNVVPLQEVLVGKTRTGILALMATVALVLLIACANVASLLLARASQRSYETSLRMVLGATGTDIARQFLLESFLLALLGGGLGIALAVLSKNFLLSLLSTLPRQDEMAIDWRVLAVTLTISLATGLLTGLAPLSQTFRLNLVSAVKEARGRTGSGRTPLKGLLVAEVALTMMVLVAAALLLRSLANLRAIDLGFNPGHMVIVPLSLPGKTARYDDNAKQNQFFQEVLQRAAHLPGITSVGAINQPALMWPATVSPLLFKDRAEPPKGQEPTANVRIVYGDYFGTVETPLLRGRKFLDADGEHSPLVAIVNRKMAETSWPGQNPLGKHFGCDSKEWEVVGVVGNVRDRGILEEITPSVYFPLQQKHTDDMTFMMRTAAAPGLLLNSIRHLVWDLDPDLPLDELQTWDDHLAAAIAEPRAKTLLLSLFALLALLLSALGIYSIFAYSVGERINEIGTRVALGAPRGAIFWLISGHGLLLTLLGIVIGAAGALAATRLMTSMLYGISPADPLVFLCTGIFLLLVALLATALPARRAMQIDPMAAIRYE